MKLLGISGSLRDHSKERRLPKAATAQAAGGVEMEVLGAELQRSVPAFDEDCEGPAPQSVEEVRQRIASADAVLFATPEYNSSVPGWLKNVVDWCSRPKATAVLKGKDVAVIGASTGIFGAVWGQADLRKTLAASGARVIDRELPVPAVDQAFDQQGALVDAELQTLLAEHLAELTEAARASAAA